MNLPKPPKWLLITLSTAVFVVGMYLFGKYFLIDELIYANYHIKALEGDLKTTVDMLEDEKARSKVAEREADVVRRANAILRASERERLGEMADLKADLAFYRRLGGANGSQAPLAVHSVELQATRSPRVYRLVLTLTQNLRWASVISGQIQLGVDGIHNDVAEHLTEDQLLAETTEPISFQFKYFQQLERLITLPEGFEANRLTIRLRSNSLRAPVEQSMEWQSLFDETTAGARINEPGSSAY